jgi:hypothetical protein
MVYFFRWSKTLRRIGFRYGLQILHSEPLILGLLSNRLIQIFCSRKKKVLLRGLVDRHELGSFSSFAKPQPRLIVVIIIDVKPLVVWVSLPFLVLVEVMIVLDFFSYDFKLFILLNCDSCDFIVTLLTLCHHFERWSSPFEIRALRVRLAVSFKNILNFIGGSDSPLFNFWDAILILIDYNNMVCYLIKLIIRFYLMWSSPFEHVGIWRRRLTARLLLLIDEWRFFHSNLLLGSLLNWSLLLLFHRSTSLLL